MGKQKFTYKDLATGKIRWTRGEFQGWTKETGLLKARYAVFRTTVTEILVPEYLLTMETKAAIKALAKQAPEAFDSLGDGGKPHNLSTLERGKA